MRYLVNVSGIVGPTHYYGGLALGNVASEANQYEASYPRRAALQSLERMLLLDQLGVRQLIIPPLALQKPFFSASAMWMANAATVSSSCDTSDGRVHLTPANLLANSHRQLECRPMTHVLKQVFEEETFFHIHHSINDPDEGAANHIVLGEHGSGENIHLAVYGGRQSKSAISSVYDNHGVSLNRVVLARQHPKAIKQGVFHNDVIAVGTAGVLLCHENAYVDQERIISSLSSIYNCQFGDFLKVITVTHDQLSIELAVQSYLFNSQLLYSAGTYILIAPSTVQQCESSKRLVTEWVTDNQCSINEVHYITLDQSMNNGGGPACLRLKLLLTEEEWESISSRFYFDNQKYEFLQSYINSHYPEILQGNELQELRFIEEMNGCIRGLYEWFGLRH